MARVVDEEAQRAKRRAILDQVGALVRVKGYERMTVQDVLVGLGISRGALYHYFDSKQSMLEALVDQFCEDAAATLLPVVHEPTLTALEKLERYAETSGQLKADRPDLIAELVRIWYGNENVLLRQKLTDGMLNYTAPVILEPIIRQGVVEGTFSTAHPEQTARIVVGIMLNLSDCLTGLLFLHEPVGDVEGRVRELAAAHLEAIERILGAAPGSVRLGSVEQLVELGRLARQHGSNRREAAR
jgi:TetR/AcrR family transcriptional regulator, transcriptional repressor for nem operon